MSTPKLSGVTEPYWSSLTEDQKIRWKYCMRGAAIVAGLTATTSGYRYVDAALTVLTAVFFIIFIETQRTYSKLTPVERKRSIRIAINLASIGIVVLGIAWFAHSGLAALAQVWVDELGRKAPEQQEALRLVKGLLILIAFPIAFIRVFRQLRVEELIWHMPREGLKRLLVLKEPKAQSFERFAAIEMGALFGCAIYASAVAALIRFFASSLCTP